MIYRVRETVLAVLNKENRGYLSIKDYNNFATQAQLEIFEGYFKEYADWIGKSILRRSHSNYADIPKIILEKINIFSKYDPMIYSGSRFSMPSDGYRLSDVVYNGTIIEEVYSSQIPYLESSDLTAPTEYFPIYIRLGEEVEIHPVTINANVNCYYIKKPVAPEWVGVSTPNLTYSPSDSTNFELHPSEEYRLVSLILQYAGVSIRDFDLTKVVAEKDIAEKQLDKQ